MQPNLEVIGSLERRIDLAVPMAAIEAEVQSRLKRLAKNVKAPGFRPGKVPLNVVSKQHGPGVRQEVLGESLHRSFSDAVASHQLKIAGMPRFEPKPSDSGDNRSEQAEIMFSATFEVYPEVKIKDLTGVSLKRPVVEVTNADVEATLEILRKQRREFQTVNRAAEIGDLARFDFRGTIDGKPFEGGEAHDFVTVVGEGRLLKDFEDNLAGLSEGQGKGFDMVFPENYQATHLAGKKVHFDVEMKEVKAPRLPEVDAEFAKSLGIEDGDISKLHAEIKSNLERETKRRVQARVKESVMDILLANAELDIPKSLVGLEIERLQSQMLADIESRGGKSKEMPLSADMFKDQAERRVRLGLILAEVVETHGLASKPEQVRMLIDDYAQSYEDPQEVVQWYYQDPQRLHEVEALALEDNVVAWVVGQVAVEDVPTKFNELMGRA
ncbi:MAG: trigger factor [Hydrogenophilaceae bacterium]|nr:trigger factor [Hydrogenophilaceae bacterium]